MIDLNDAMYSLQSAGEAMQEYADDAVVQEKYRAALQIYAKKLSQQWELSHAFLKEHQDVNKKIFEDAMYYLDVAIENADSELAESALSLITVIKEKEPDFFKRYYGIMFGRR